ncbi:phosphatidylinositol kinase- protein kinase tor1, partial [Serendipita sp. 399]
MASTDVFETILASLRSSDESTREKGLQNFQDFVRSSLASSKSDDQESFWKEIINKILFPLTATSDTPQEKLVGIAAIGEFCHPSPCFSHVYKLLLSPSDDAHPTSAPASQSSNPSASSTPSTRSLLYRLLRYLKNLLPDPNLVVMMAASQTYGAIFRIGGGVLAETVGEMEIQHAVGLMSEVEGEWTGSKNRELTIARLSQAQSTPTAKPTPPRPPREKILAPHARMAGVLILIQIASYAPHIYHQHVSLILSRIMYPLRDPSRFFFPVATSNPNVGDGTTPPEPFEFLGWYRVPPSSVTGTLATGPGDNKPGFEVQDIVRRMAARLFGVTLAVIEGREPGLLDQIPSNEEVETPLKRNSSIALSASAARLERTGTLSTIHQPPLSPISP